MPSMLDPGMCHWRNNFFQVGKPFIVFLGVSSTDLTQAFTLAQLSDTESCGYIIHVVFVAWPKNIVIPGSMFAISIPRVLHHAVRAHQPHAFSVPRMISD